MNSYLHASLKRLNRRMEKLGQTVDRLEVLAYRYQKLSMMHKELAELLNHIDVAAFEVRQDYTLLKEAERCIHAPDYF